MNIAQEVHLYFWFTQLFYFPNQREAKGSICICFNNRSVGISGFWRRIITLLVKDFFFSLLRWRWDMRRKENDVLVQVWKWVLEFIKYYFTFDEIIAIIIYLLFASLKSISVISGGPFIFHHCQIILYTAPKRRIYLGAF